MASSSKRGPGSHFAPQPPKKQKTDHKRPPASSICDQATRTIPNSYRASHPTVPPIPSAPKPFSTEVDLPPLPPLAPGDLSRAPFIHSSRADSKYANELNYERLEFLGDANLELMATRLIYTSFPTLQPGRQSQLREKLVRNSTLAHFSRGYGFGERLRSHIQSQLDDKVLADIFEAFVAAVTLSSLDGFDVAEKWMRQLWAPIMADEQTRIGATQPQRNWKQELQDRLVGYDVKIEYRWLDKERRRKTGEQHVEKGVFLTGWGFHNERLGLGEGAGQKVADMAAARDALENRRELIEEAERRKRTHLEERKRLKAEQEQPANDAADPIAKPSAHMGESSP